VWLYLGHDGAQHLTVLGSQWHVFWKFHPKQCCVQGVACLFLGMV
jgi:hypothetical protein